MTTSLDWPAAISLPTISGNGGSPYSIKPKSNVDRTEVEAGQAIQRRRSTSTTDDVAVTFELTLFQFALFESWYVNEAYEGAAWFNITLLGGMGRITCEARFKAGTDLTQTARNGGRFSIGATLEVRNRPKLSAADLSSLLALGEDGDALIAAINDLGLLFDDGLWSSP